jgi:hypothetical protein
MTKKVVDLGEARRKKRRHGWTMSEILKRAAEERALYQKIAKDEPDDITSGGDMKKILEEPDDDDKPK